MQNVRHKKSSKRANCARINLAAVRPLRGRFPERFATADSVRFAPFTSGYGYRPLLALASDKVEREDVFLNVNVVAYASMLA